MKKNLLFALAIVTASTFAYGYDEDGKETVVVEGPRIPPGGLGGPGVLPIGGSPGAGTSCADPTCGGTISKPEGAGSGKGNGAQKEKLNEANKEKAKETKKKKPGFLESIATIFAPGEMLGIETLQALIDKIFGMQASSGKVTEEEYTKTYSDGTEEKGKRRTCEFSEINEPNRKGCMEMKIKYAPNPDAPGERHVQVTFSRVYHVYNPSNPKAGPDGYFSVPTDTLLFIVDSEQELKNIIDSI